MADNTDNKPREVQRKPKTGITGWISTIINTLLFSLLISILIECVGIAFLWPELGETHSETMLSTEYGYLSHDFTESLIPSVFIDEAKEYISTIYETLALKTGLMETLNKGVAESDGIVTHIIVSIGVYLKAIINIILLFLVRLLILILSSPIFILAMLVGIVDGLVRRDIRRFGSGRESSFLYYHAKAWIKPIIVIAWLIYLSVPFSIHPNVVFIPMAFLFGLSLSITFGSFKKYL